MLPIIDFADFAGGDAATRRAIAQEIGTACESVGFLYLRNHGVEQATIDTALAAMRAFFARPEADKLTLARPPGRYRGYIPVIPFANNSNGRPPVLYEAFITGDPVAPDDPSIAASQGLRWPTPWPSEPAGFEAAITGYWLAMTRLAEDLLRAFAIALGQDDDALLAHFTAPLSNISLLHYPARSAPPDGTPDDVRPHHDTNALTVLLPGVVGGLQVLGHDGAWLDVPPQPGCFVVNIGTMMECWSNGRFRSTLHRVHPPIGTERYAIGYFAAPAYDTLVAPLPGITPGTSAQTPAPIHAGRALAAFVALFD